MPYTLKNFHHEIAIHIKREWCRSERASKQVSEWVQDNEWWFTEIAIFYGKCLRGLFYANSNFVANLRGVKNNNNFYFNVMAMKKFLSTTKPIKIDCSIIILASFIILFIFLAVELPKYISILWEHTRALFTFGMICVCICIKRSSHAFYSTLHGSGVGGNVDRDIFAVVLIVVNNRNWFYPFDAKSNMPKCIERDTHIMHHDTSRLSFCYFIYMLLMLLRVESLSNEIREIPLQYSCMPCDEEDEIDTRRRRRGRFKLFSYAFQLVYFPLISINR